MHDPWFESWARPQKIVYATLPMASSFASLVASSAMLIRIVKSSTKLNKPDRRLIFIMSFFDFLAALATMASVFVSPAGSKMWAFGNDCTCSVQGFLIQTGTTGSPLYSIGLVIFYLYIIKYDMRESIFSKKIERYLHAIPNILVWGASISLVSSGYINVESYGCWIASSPQRCAHDSDVDCVRGQHGNTLRLIFVGLPIMITLIACVVLMIFVTSAAINTSSKKKRNSIQNQDTKKGTKRKKISMELKRRTQRTNKKGEVEDSNQPNFPFTLEEEKNEEIHESPLETPSLLPSAILHAPSGVKENNVGGNSILLRSAIRKKKDSKRGTSSTAENESRNSRPGGISRFAPVLSLISAQSQQSGSKSERKSTNRNKEIVSQAIIFILALFGTYFPILVCHLHEQIHGESPYWLHLLSRTMLGFQGFFNVLVHTRPHVISLRKRCKDYSWFRALVEVVKSGGDHDGKVRGMKRSKRRLSWISRHRPTNSAQVGSPRQSPQKTVNVENHPRTKRKSVKDDLDILESQRTDDCTKSPKAIISPAECLNEQDKNQDVRRHQDADISDNCKSVSFSDSELQDELAKIHEAASFFNHQANDGV